LARRARTASDSCGTTRCAGAIGAVVLVDTMRLADDFAAVDYFEQREPPFVVAVDCLNGLLAHAVEDVHEALTLSRTCRSCCATRGRAIRPRKR
jgi:signal recognition particle receptor subunit beta